MKCILRGGIAELMRGGKRVSKGDWGGADGDEGEGGRRGEVEEDIRACEIFFFGSLLLGSSPGRSALQSAE